MQRNDPFCLYIAKRVTAAEKRRKDLTHATFWREATSHTVGMVVHYSISIGF